MGALPASEKQFKVTKYMSYVFFVLINILTVLGWRGWQTFCTVVQYSNMSTFGALLGSGLRWILRKNTTKNIFGGKVVKNPDFGT